MCLRMQLRSSKIVVQRNLKKWETCLWWQEEKVKLSFTLNHLPVSLIFCIFIFYLLTEIVANTAVIHPLDLTLVSCFISSRNEACMRHGTLKRTVLTAHKQTCTVKALGNSGVVSYKTMCVSSRAHFTKKKKKAYYVFILLHLRLVW